MDLTAATPAQIDTAIAAIEARYHKTYDALDNARESLKTYAGRRNYASMVETIHANIAHLTDVLHQIAAERAPYDAEYTRRGGWTRYFLVGNSNGHIHNGTMCSTCRPTTRYIWLVDLAGAPASELYAHDAYGAQVCSTCYPEAPVAKTPATPKLADDKCDGRPVGGARLQQKCTKCAHVGSARAWRKHKIKK